MRQSTLPEFAACDSPSRESADNDDGELITTVTDLEVGDTIRVEDTKYLVAGMEFGVGWHHTAGCPVVVLSRPNSRYGGDEHILDPLESDHIISYDRNDAAVTVKRITDENTEEVVDSE